MPKFGASRYGVGHGMVRAGPIEDVTTIVFLARDGQRRVSREYGEMVFRELAPTDSIAALTALLHAAYARLGAMGFNYTAVDQTEDMTHRRISRGLCLVAVDDGALVGTITLRAAGRSSGCRCYERPDVATIGQFGVLPGRQGAGIGTRLLRESERLALTSQAAELALDTSEGADHLIAWYAREGFRVVEHAQWSGKTYRSVIMSRLLKPATGLGADQSSRFVVR